jgi:alpha-glucosidase
MERRLGPDAFGEPRGWTGYSWNRELFPDPEGFLSELHSMGYKTALNLHPASGIREYEDCYDAFVKDYLSRTSDYDGPRDYIYGKEPHQYAGVPKPAGREGYSASVPYRMDQEAWADSYFGTVIRPLEHQGVDFWWLDWQQWRESRYVKGLSNTFWINYAFFTDKAQSSSERPFIYHRWGGLGSHRYQLGFSGDTYDEWSVLEYLPYFTATASNVGYGYWGHDIGGHMQKRDNQRLTDPEMYTRWLQFGVFTPIFKTHSTQSANLERKIWAYPDHFEYMLEAIRLRYTLSPYIYTFAREAYDTGVSICRPLYYAYPEADDAYSFNQEYLFGDRILATAICEPAGADGKSARIIWFPKGDDWYDMALHTVHKGGSVKTLRYAIDENPWYVKAGSIIPLASTKIKSLQEASNVLGILIVPGKGQSSFTLYEDDGTSRDYDSACARTLISKTVSGSKVKVIIGPRKGSYEGMPESREIYLALEGVSKLPKSVKCNGESAGECSLEGSCLVITLPAVSASAQTTVEVSL